MTGPRVSVHVDGWAFLAMLPATALATCLFTLDHPPVDASDILVACFIGCSAGVTTTVCALDLVERAQRLWRRLRGGDGDA